MLEQVWRKGNPIALLVGIYIGATTVENSVEIPQKTKNRIPFDPDLNLRHGWAEPKHSKWLKLLCSLSTLAVNKSCTA